MSQPPPITTAAIFAEMLQQRKQTQQQPSHHYYYHHQQQQPSPPSSLSQQMTSGVVVYSTLPSVISGEVIPGVPALYDAYQMNAMMQYEAYYQQTQQNHGPRQWTAAAPPYFPTGPTVITPRRSFVTVHELAKLLSCHLQLQSRS